MSDYIIINKKQMAKLIDIGTNFDKVDYFKISVDDTSGIGTGVVVSFNLFEDSTINLYDSDGDTKIDITDISEW